MNVRTRFAPSPTGFLHVGGARTALFSWLHARRHGGSFILRIEDTDLERSTPESVDAILQGMTWLGLDYDEGPFYQTQRFDRYFEVIEQLLQQGHAYRCRCDKTRLDALREQQMANKQKPRYDGRCRDLDISTDEPHVIRFRNPADGEVVVEDRVRGPLVFANAELDDLILRRSDGSPTYNLTVVVDDFDMGITDVIRGDDHISNTPRQINILKALGAEPPRYAHVPMILGEDGARLSKRHGAVSVLQYRDQGFLPEALLNYLVRLGWSHGDQEVFSLEQMLSLFDLADINHAPSAFNTDKLLWLNQQYIKTADAEHLARLLGPHLASRGIGARAGVALSEAADALRERARTLEEMAEACRFIYQDFEEFDAKAAKKALRPVAIEPLEQARAGLEQLPDWQANTIEQMLEQLAETMGLNIGKIGQPLRVAVTGSGSSPGIGVTLYLVGRKVCLQRIDRALDYCRQRAAQA